jgi:hypothetical protein
MPQPGTPAALVAALVLGGFGLSSVRAEDAEESKARAEAGRSLRTIALAMHEYHSKERHFPPASLRAPDGKPLLSWRVAILPFLGQQELYDAFHLDEPWDSPHNKPLVEKMPKVFALPIPAKTPHTTDYKVFVGDGTVFEPVSDVAIASITDGPSLTILAVRAGPPVPWTKPEDIPFTPGEPLPRITGPLKGGFLAVMADGSIHFVSDKAKPGTVEAAIMRNDGRAVKPEDLDPK